MTSSSAWRANRLRIVGWGFAAFLLLLPAVAMQFTREVAWGPMDFVTAAALLGAAGLGLELAARVRAPHWRLAAALAVVGAILLVWAELAVGIV